MKTETIPERLICQATLNGTPISGVLLLAGFGVWNKNSYSFIFGPTNHDGCAVLTHQEIIESATAQLNSAIMDYQPIEGVFSGNILLKVLVADDIKKAIDAYDLFHENFIYSPHYKENLKEALGIATTQDMSAIKVKCLK